MTSVNFADLVNEVAPRLSIPELKSTETVLECAFAYGECGWWMVPVAQGSKHPGSILGDGWPNKSSKERGQLEIWFGGREDRGIALHTGRSGAYIVDVDRPEDLPPFLRKTLLESGAPYQSTRVNAVGRGHYVFALPNGVRYTNSAGGLGTAWGEIRTGNSVIIAEPTIHVEKDAGGCYTWRTKGDAPLLPREIASKIRKRDSFNGDDVGVTGLGDLELEAFVKSLNHTLATELLQIRVDQSLPSFRRGSRHNALTKFLLFGFLDSRAGLYPAVDMIDEALKVFLLFKPRQEWTSPSEFWDLVKWTAGAAKLFPDERVSHARETGLALVQPGVKAWLKAVSNV